MKRALLLLFGLVLIGGYVGYKMYNKPHEDMSRAAAEIKITAPELFAEFEADEAKANAKYLDKIVEVSGKVLQVDKDENGTVNVILDTGGMFGVVCKLDDLSEHPRTSFETGSEVRFKGKCTGMNMDVLLVRCVEVE
ncbi:MAG: hypothetical protein D6714_06295 [Bacteroidetes bacterium]|nr:MAG: hypothetical protein D6714_06295 [Bacteroidota bacterium]